MESPSLKRKLKTLRTHVRRTEELADFLKKNPEFASDCAIKAAMWQGQGSLYFEDRAYIQAVGSDPVRLRMQRDSATVKIGQQIEICDDVSALSRSALRSVYERRKSISIKQFESALGEHDQASTIGVSPQTRLSPLVDYPTCTCHSLH